MNFSAGDNTATLTDDTAKVVHSFSEMVSESGCELRG